MVLWKVLELHSSSAESTSEGAVVLGNAVGSSILAAPVKHSAVLLHAGLAHLKTYLYNTSCSLCYVRIAKILGQLFLAYGFSPNSPVGQPLLQLLYAVGILKSCDGLRFILKPCNLSPPEGQCVLCYPAVYTHSSLVDAIVKELHISLPCWLPQAFAQLIIDGLLAVHIPCAI